MAEDIPNYAETGERPPGWELRNQTYQPTSAFDFRFRYGRDRHCPDDVGQSPHVHCAKCNLVLERHVGGVPCQDDNAPKRGTSKTSSRSSKKTAGKSKRRAAGTTS